MPAKSDKSELLTVRSKLERDKDGTWWYLHIPERVRRQLKQAERRGTIPVEATIGSTSWPASLMPWADGSAQLVVKKVVREKERLELGAEVVVHLRLRLSASKERITPYSRYPKPTSPPPPK